MAKRTRSDTLTVDRLADMFDLPEWDRIEELNVEYVGEAGYAARREAEAEGEDDELKLERIAEEAENAERGELYDRWAGAVVGAAEAIFGRHHLSLKLARPLSYDYAIVPRRTWLDAARAIAATINGVGLVHVPREDYSRAPQKFVLSHLGAVRHQPEVYGDTSAKRLFEMSF